MRKSLQGFLQKSDSFPATPSLADPPSRPQQAKGESEAATLTSSDWGAKSHDHAPTTVCRDPSYTGSCGSTLQVTAKFPSICEPIPPDRNVSSDHDGFRPGERTVSGGLPV